jgi:GntR family transcriptional regulator
MARISLRAETETRIRQMITTELQVGDLLPSESDLAERYEVSRSTVREAVGTLVSEGVVERRWGVGTRVRPLSEQPLSLGITRMAPAWESVKAAGRTPGITAFRLDQIKANSELAGHLGIDAGARVWEINRTLTIDGTPALHLHERIPTRVVPRRADLAALADVGNDLLTALGGESAGLTMEGWLEAQTADTSMATALAVEPYSPLLKYYAIVFDRHRTRLCYTEAYYRTDLITVRFSTT